MLYGGIGLPVITHQWHNINEVSNGFAQSMLFNDASKWTVDVKQISMMHVL
jgi:hypothetical protein